MILGKTLMWTAFLASVFSLFSYILATRGKKRWLNPARGAHAVMTVSLIAAVAYLLSLILRHQFQFSYVYRYSSRDLPLHFLISTFWAGQEGTFLLWAFYTSLLGFVFYKTARHFEPGVMSFVMILQSFLLLILVKLSPFATYPVTPPDGAGLNPLLQDYWMVIHPPLLFMGFASFTIPGAFAMYAMARKDTDEWVKGALPWTAFAVLVLGTAICLGGYWAYRTLGWGGYWGWDPVENSSLVPWLFGVALLHGMVVQSRRGLMKRLNLFMAVTAFMLVLYSTFLTRSGVLGDFSVHSFVDLGINGFLVAFVAVYGILGFGLYFWRVRGMKDSGFGRTFLTREYGMFLGSLTVALFALLVLIGTSAPLLTRIAGEPSNVSNTYYQVVAIPFGILISWLLAVVPLLTWNARRESPLWKTLLPSVFLGALAGALLYLLGIHKPQHVALVFSAATALFVNLEIVVGSIRRNLPRAGGYIVHVGIGLMIIGIITSTVYDHKESVVLPKGELTEALGYRMIWHGTHPIDGGNKMAYDIAVIPPHGRAFTASPVMFYSDYNGGVMRRPAISRFLRHDLYLSPQGVDRDEALDRMDKRELTLTSGETATVDSLAIHFDAVEPISMTKSRIDVAGILTITTPGGITETVRPELIADAEGQQYVEALFKADGTKIVMRKLDAQAGKALFYLRTADSRHYNLPIEALYLEASVKPLIMLLWIGTFLAMGGLILTVIHRARSARAAVQSIVRPRPATPPADPAEEETPERQAVGV